MKVTLIGDLHTCSSWLNASYMPKDSIQLGDLCLLPYNTFCINNKTRGVGGDWRTEKRFFIDGNHDNFPELDLSREEPYRVADGLYHIPRGFVSGGTMFIGGAYSIDKDFRIPGLDWFREEQLSMSQYNDIMQIECGRIDTIISHDFPSFLYPHFGIYDMPSQHCEMLWRIYNDFKPRRWIGGHHHRSFRKTIGNCEFFVLAEAQKMEFKLNLGEDFFSKNYE